MEASLRPEAALPMVIADSSVLIDFLTDRQTPQTEWLRVNLNRRRIGITTLILTEVLQGVRREDQFNDVLVALDQFAVLEASARETAVQSARNYRALRQRGITIRSAIDCLTATFCIEGGIELLHNDRDFVPFERHLHLKAVRTTPA